jgi:Leucine-rich repeat (LRR) protein
MRYQIDEMTDIVPIEVITRALEFLWDWQERSRARLVCRRWDRAFTSLLENSLSSQQSSEGEWTPVGRYCTKHILCHLHRMPLEVLASLTAVDWGRSYLGDGINKAFMLLVDSLAVLVDRDSGRRSETTSLPNLNLNDSPLQLRFNKLVFEGQGHLKDEGLVYLANANGGAVGRKLESLNLCRCLGVTEVGLEAIGKLQNLTELNLARCQKLSGAGIARLLRQLPKLTSVLLYHIGGVTDETLEALSKTVTLRRLEMDDCCLVTDVGLNALRTLPNLSKVSVSGCQKLTEASALTLANLPLQELDMHWCSWSTDQSMDPLSRCASLTKLRVSSPKMTDTGLSRLTKLHNLVDLDISNCISFSASGLIDAFSAGLRHLTTLRLFQCNSITDPSLACIAKLPLLTSLDIACCRNVSDDGVATLRDARKLRCLFLKGWRLTAACLLEVGRLPALEEFSSRFIEDSALSAMGEVGKIRTLEVSDCSKITDGGIAALARGSLHMMDLNLNNCQQLTNVGALELCLLRALRRLKVIGCAQLTDAAACAILKACPLITSLSFSGCCRITDVTLAQLWRLRNLDSLDLSRISMTDAGLKEVANLEGLQSLNLSFCMSVTDIGMSLLTRLWGLEYLSVEACPHVTDASMKLMTDLPRLNLLNAYGCEKVTSQLAIQAEAKGVWLRT